MSAWLYVHGIEVELPDTATHQQIRELIALLERIALEREVADQVDQGGT